DTFEKRGRGALGAYLRQAVVNQIRDQHRQLQTRGEHGPITDEHPGASPSPYDEAVAAETRQRYLTALAALSESDRELVVAHVELGYSHDQLGCMTGRTANAARVALGRALRRLADKMGDVKP